MPITHAGSRENLRGKSPPEDLIRRFSNDLAGNSHDSAHVHLFASDDKGVHPDNGIRFYQAALKAGVPAELHLFEPGGHGSELLVKQLVERITMKK